MNIVKIDKIHFLIDFKCSISPLENGAKMVLRSFNLHNFHTSGAIYIRVSKFVIEFEHYSFVHYTFLLFVVLIPVTVV